MSTQHTPGRLKVFSAYATPEIRTQDDAFVANTSPYNEANARRLVACWNACEGISTESLESAGNAFNGWKLASYAMNDAKSQRDELLAALEKIAGFTLSQFMGPHDMALECVTVACDAIAKVKGGAA